MAAILRANNIPTNVKKLFLASTAITHRSYHEVTGDIICPSMVQGIDHIRDSRLNKVTTVSLYIFVLNHSYLTYYLSALGTSVHFRREASVRYSWIDATVFQNASAANRSLSIQRYEVSGRS